jgi:hypothetical protein
VKRQMKCQLLLALMLLVNAPLLQAQVSCGREHRRVEEEL